MRIGKIEFGKVFGSSGSRGFYGEGYWYHFLLDYAGAGFISKTTTLERREGHLKVVGDKVVEKIPKCIKVNLKEAVALNAVGLSGPGLEKLLESGKWQEREDNFFISLMCGNVGEAKEMVRMIGGERFRGGVGLQINLSCPNAVRDLNCPNVKGEMNSEVLGELKELGWPVVVKVGSWWDVEEGIRYGEMCDGISCSNTWGWERVPDSWKIKYFGNLESPLKEYGGGGMSGRCLMEPTLEWIKEIRRRGFKGVVMGGGGIMDEMDGRRVFGSGADAIEIGSVGFLRPWRVKRIINEAIKD